MESPTVRPFSVDVAVRASEPLSLGSPTMLHSHLHYVEPKVFSRSKFAGEKDDAEEEVQKVLEESREREDRIRNQLVALKEHMILAVGAQSTDNHDEDQKDLENEKLAECEVKINKVKDTIENILSVTKATHNEVQRTKDIVSSMKNEGIQSKMSGSIHSVFIDDCDEEQIYASANPRPLDGEKSTLSQQQQTPQGTTANEDEAISTFYNTNSLCRIRGHERGPAGQHRREPVWSADQSAPVPRLRPECCRKQIKECEQKVLQTEGDRLDKEKENLSLKEAILKMKKDLEEKEAQLRRMSAGRPKSISQVNRSVGKPVETVNVRNVQLGTGTEQRRVQHCVTITENYILFALSLSPLTRVCGSPWG